MLERKTLCNERSDASLQGWGAGLPTLGPWSTEERKFHKNVLELKATKLAIISFTLKERDAISVHIRVDSMTTLSYLVKTGGYQKPRVDSDQQRNLTIPFERKITITPEYLPGSMNI